MSNKTIRMILFASFSTLMLTTMLPAQARLFGDSILLQDDGFSDEISGEGPDLILIASPSDDANKATVKHLRRSYRVHLIHTDSNDAVATLNTYLSRRRIKPVALIDQGGGSVSRALAALRGDLKKTMVTQAADDAALDAFLKS